VCFDENYLGVNLLNASFGFLQDGPFNVVSENGSPLPFFSSSTGQSNSILVSTGSLTSFPKSTSQSISILTGPSSPLTKNISSLGDVLQIP